MKVTLEGNYRKYYTLEELDQAKRVIAAEKGDTTTAKEYAEIAIREFLKDENGISTDYIVETFTAKASTAKNRTIWNEYCMSDDDPDQETGTLDVWIEFAAELGKGYIRGGAYLSDIWKTGKVDYKDRMYVRKAEWK